MAFLDNSGDIILDAVLTDAGRRRLARGDGSFKIAKFALGDDEINYGNYDGTNTNGSAYYDLEILQTPILEAFTNNISSLKSKLITMTNNNLLYLPVIKLNSVDTNAGKFKVDTSGAASGSFAVLVDKDTMDEWGSNSGNESSLTNYIDGFNGPLGATGGGGIRLDQGLDTTEISNAFNLDAELTENQYIVELDNRFATIVGMNGTSINPSFIDDDNIASYFLSTKAFVGNLEPDPGNGNPTDSNIGGPRGTKLTLSLLASLTLRTSDYLFDQVGTSTTFEDQNIKYIDSSVRVQGATTGYRVDVPVRFIKKVANTE